MFATWGTPEITDGTEGDYVKNVWISRYNWDRAVDAFFNFFEFIYALPVIGFIGYKMVEAWVLNGFNGTYLMGASFGVV